MSGPDRTPATQEVTGLADFVRGLVPLAVRDLRSELEERLRRVPTPVNEYGFDRYGMSPRNLADRLLPAALLYRHYFRVETIGAEHVPPGRVLLIANHAGQLPFDAMMVGIAMLLESEPPRISRGMAEYWVSRLPFVNVAATRGGQMVGTPENCEQLLESEECVLVFPEGVRGMNKLYRDRERLMRFGTGFVRLALESDSPIVPVAVVGSDDQNPGLANLSGIARVLGIPAFPITPTFPLLGPLGLLPMPVKYRIEFGAPLDLEGSPDAEDEEIGRHVELVRDTLSGMLARGRAARSGHRTRR